MSTRLRNAHSILGSHLQAPVNALVLMLALGTAAAQSADKPQVGTYSLLYSFQNSSSDGCGPSAGLVRDSSGNLYGTTGYGAQYGYGNVFKVTPSGTETCCTALPARHRTGQRG